MKTGLVVTLLLCVVCQVHSQTVNFVTIQNGSSNVIGVFRGSALKMAVLPFSSEKFVSSETNLSSYGVGVMYWNGSAWLAFGATWFAYWPLQSENVFVQPDATPFSFDKLENALGSYDAVVTTDNSDTAVLGMFQSGLVSGGVVAAALFVFWMIHAVTGGRNDSE